MRMEGVAMLLVPTVVRVPALMRVPTALSTGVRPVGPMLAQHGRLASTPSMSRIRKRRPREQRNDVWACLTIPPPAPHWNDAC